jgi:predicted lipoprotein with Yx(FWY)xxD motif
MKKLPIRHRCSLAVVVLLTLWSVPTLAQFDVSAPYPSEVALVAEVDKGYVFRRNPGAQRLYIYDGDHDGRSFCNNGCASEWPPVLAPATAQAIGQWSYVHRDDGKLQWAYRGHPVYSRYHDAFDNPQGDGEDGMWHLLPYEK